MNIADYPKFTIIMRGYTFAQADGILQAMAGLEDQFAVEMTLNTQDALTHIHKLKQVYGKKVHIGAGTVRTLAQAEAAYEAGAEFLLGPHVFTKEMLDFAKKKKIISVPAAMTPSEINDMFTNGADIVKIFPAAVVTPRFFKDVQAPLGTLPLMGVGGINAENAQAFFDNGASYLGMGSGIFDKTDIKEVKIDKLAQSLKKLVTTVK